MNYLIEIMNKLLSFESKYYRNKCFSVNNVTQKRINFETRKNCF